MKQFVLSSSEFKDVKGAEAKVNSWYKSGKLDNREVKLYKIVEVYDMSLKFTKRKHV